MRASIERKVEGLRKQVEEQRQREWESLSEETREAWERFERLKVRDLGVLNPVDHEPEERRVEYAEYSKPPLKKIEQTESWDGIRRLKDDCWD